MGSLSTRECVLVDVMPVKRFSVWCSWCYQLVLSGITWKQVLAYLYGIIVIGKGFEDQLKNIRAVLLRMRQHNLKLKPSKCSLFQRSVKILGKLVTPQGVAVDPAKIAAVTDWPEPKSVREVEAFLGFVNYHRAHLKDYAKLSSSLYQLTGAGARKRPFQWTAEHRLAFLALKDDLVTAAVLGFPTEEGTFVLDTDASETQIGAELSAVQDGKEVVFSFSYGSFVLTPAQRRYCTRRKDLLVVSQLNGTSTPKRSYSAKKSFWLS